MLGSATRSVACVALGEQQHRGHAHEFVHLDQGVLVLALVAEVEQRSGYRAQAAQNRLRRVRQRRMRGGPAEAEAAEETAAPVDNRFGTLGQWPVVVRQ